MNIFRYPDAPGSSPHLFPGGFIVWANHPTMHAECTPGYAKLLCDLGFSVDVFMLENKEQETALCRFGPDLPVRLHIFSSAAQILSALAGAARQSAGLMITTGGLFYPNEDVASYKKTPITPHVHKLLDRLRLPPYPHLLALAEQFKKTVFVFHKTWQLAPDIRFLLGERIEKGAVLLFESEEFPMVNPHYFGKVISPPKNEMTRFAVVGEVRNDKRSYPALVHAVTELERTGHDFRIDIIGRGDLATPPERLSRTFRFHGYLSYQDLYDVLDSTDYILPLLDPSNPDHETYRRHKTSGCFQLAYGFHKPVVLERSFAEARGFTDDNAILYSGANGLQAGMEQAVRTSRAGYDVMRTGVAKRSAVIQERSRESLGRVLGRP